jgi:ribosomal protein L17
MGRKLALQGLNQSSRKHFWAMMRNMFTSLIIHEKITTTYARARVLLPMANSFFAKALKNNYSSYKVLGSFVRTRAALNKLTNQLRLQYQYN